MLRKSELEAAEHAPVGAAEAQEDALAVMVEAEQGQGHGKQMHDDVMALMWRVCSWLMSI